MITKEFEVRYKSDNWTNSIETARVHSESFSSMAECLKVVAGRPMKDCNKDAQYLQTGGINGKDPEWLGFSSVEEFVDICKNGLPSSDMVREVMKYAGKAVVEDKEKLCKKKLDVAGGAVDVPLYLSGSPECMLGLQRKTVKSRIIKATVNCEVSWFISVEDYTKAGMAIARSVAALEKAGYRIRLVANACIKHESDLFSAVSVTVKRENEPCNFRRLLMPMLSTAFFRGTVFNWLSTNPYFDAGYGLGSPLKYAFTDSERDEKIGEVLQRINGGACARLSIVDTVDMIKSSGVERTENFIKAKMMALE